MRTAELLPGSNQLSEVARVIAATPSVTLVCHYGPDPDAFGSMCGLAAILRGMGKRVTCVNEDGPVARLLFVPGAESILSDFPEQKDPLLVACDCGDIKRIGDRIGPEVRKYATVISIDHHQSNDLFGNLNYVVPAASSTSELIVDLAAELGVGIPSDGASALYMGLVADTGSFRYSSTTERTFEVAAELVRRGARPSATAQQMFSRVSRAAIQLHSEALSKMQFFGNDRVVELVVTDEMCARHGAQTEDADDLKHISQTIDGVVISTVIREAVSALGEPLWKVSLRSRSSGCDVAAIADEFGGGGHRAAAAFRWRGSLVDLQTRLRARLVQALPPVQ